MRNKGKSQAPTKNEQHFSVIDHQTTTQKTFTNTKTENL